MIQNRYIIFNTRDELLRLDWPKVAYMEGDGNYTHIVLTNKLKTTICMNLSDMQKLISGSLKERAAIFARIGKRHILTDGENFAFHLKISIEALKQMKTIVLESVKNKIKK